MAASRRPRLVDVIQKALANGPISRDALLTALQQAGFRADEGVVWETCRLHGIADLEDDMWMPRGWAAPIGADPQANGGTSQQRRPAISPVDRSAEEQADAEVQRLAVRHGLPLSEPVAPVGPVPDGWAEVAAAAARAFRDELKEVANRRTQSDMPLSSGEEVSTAGSQRKLVRYEVEGELGVAEGTTALLIVDDVQIPVEVVSVFGNVVTLSLPHGAAVVPEATLRLDLSWLLTAQSERLGELAHGGPGFNAEAALAVVTPCRDGGPAARVRLAGHEAAGLNAGQRNAVELGLAPGLTWLWGPPGTGKTTTISALVAKLCEQGRRVLLAAPTNAALDVAIKAVLKRAPHLGSGALVRVGQPSDPALIDRPEGRILVDEIAAEQGAPLARHRVEVNERLRDRRAVLEELKQRRHGRLTAREESLRLRLETEIAELQALDGALGRKLLEVRRHVCRKATVVAATAHQLVLEVLKGITFDVVVLDEASMTTAALAMLVAGAGQGHTIIAGDFRQLPPVVVAQTPAAQEWLHRSPFEKAGVTTAVAERRPPARLAALTEQYRMRRQIGDIVSTAFYPESPLQTAPAVADRPVRSRAPWAASNLVVVDTSGMRARTARRQGMVSRYNLMHAQLIAALTAEAVADAHDLAMITPFAPQARLLESLLPEKRMEQWAASTVHRFQGDERDIVVYDTVDTGRGVTPLHMWFTEGDTGSEGARLLNVAASRARDHLLIVGALDRLHRIGAARTPVWTFFAHLLDRAERLPWDRALALSTVTERVEPEDLVERLRADIERADTVEMWLPGVLTYSLADLVPALLSVHGGKPESEAVTIWVEPEADGHLPDPARYAHNKGVNVRPCLPILESGAVIGDVVWSAAGSLCGPDPGLVLRTEHRAFADAVRRAQRRRPGTGPGGAPGSGQRGDRCGRCERMLIRYEQGRLGAPDLRYACAACDRRTRHADGR